MNKMNTNDEKKTSFNTLSAKFYRRIYQEFNNHNTDSEKIDSGIAELEKMPQDNGIEIPSVIPPPVLNSSEYEDRMMCDGTLNSLMKSITSVKDHNQMHEVYVQYRNLSFWNVVPERTILTVGSTLHRCFLGSGPKKRVDILKDLNGRILPKTMTLLMGPPGCGKTSFLKALACQLNVGSAHLEGEILYNGDPVDCGKYLVGKIASYVDERDQHAPTLTVRETLEFAWKATTGGHHSYNIAKDAKSAEILDRSDAHMVKLNNVITGLGLRECVNTPVGDGAIRGISGGQKRRVTLGEMLLPPRSIKYMDEISNGLDSATAFDLIQQLDVITKAVGLTTVISLLQPSPAIFYTFEDLILMADGEIIYHGPTTQAMQYFSDLGYQCPEIMDVADFLQEIPSADGRRFSVGNTTASGAPPPVGTTALVQAWKSSSMLQAMVEAMDVQVKESTGQWPAVYSEPYANTFWVSFLLCLDRQNKITIRNAAFLKGRFFQSVVVGGIAGSLFSNLSIDDANSMSGILYFCALLGALSAMSTLPMVFQQRAVFYKHSRSLFFQTAAFVMAQTVAMYPIQIAETLAFTTIIYWSVGMSSDDDGSRYFTFMLIVFVFGLCVSQFFRLLASSVASPSVASTMSSVSLILMILFSGFIIPKSNIPPGWIWFYWINPMAYVLRCVTVNEFLAPDYDFLVCVDDTCTQEKRYGDVVLESRGNPTEQVWVWYGVIIMFGMYICFLLLNILNLAYVRIEPTPPPPLLNPEDLVEETADPSAIEAPAVEIPFEPVSFSFKDVWYTVKLPSGEELDLLKGVSGFFEPGTVTALMGSSGAGKTTLLDVLSGRKNTGEITGGMFVNGQSKNPHTFKQIMGYVEQFDTLLPRDTAREAVEFSAALRLPSDTTAEARSAWVTSVLSMLELLPLENTMIGNVEIGGMSFEQKKRVSIAVELAANPAILFLDEPTTGLDSRAAQVIVRCIKRVAASGRTIVCTIHQPSAVIFEAFDALLLLRRGGQTVFFGELGEQSAHLISYFEAIPDVVAKPKGHNPATWMLEVIGAGTGGNTAGSVVDFHEYYKQSSACVINTAKVDALCIETIELDDLEDGPTIPVNDSYCGFLPVYCGAIGASTVGTEAGWQYTASYATQFRYLMSRFMLSYWRSPKYNFSRMIVSIVIALVFSSTYANQQYSTDVDVISRVAVIYITVLFMGVVNLKAVQPVVLEERPAIYREMYSKMYDTKVYTIACTLVEVPYLIVSSVLFVIPFFFIVGFDQDGTAEKFFWYWLFQGLYMSLMIFLGHLLSTALATEAVGQVIGGMLATLLAVFAGFLIKPGSFADFWIFMYWLDPLHYAVEGLVVTQFHKDSTPITIVETGEVTTAGAFVADFYPDWQYGHRGLVAMALVLFIVGFRLVTYWSLEYMRHDKR